MEKNFIPTIINSKYFVALAIILASVFFILFTKKYDLKTNNVQRIDINKYISIENSLIGKHILSLSKLLQFQKRISNSNQFIYLYTSSGCGNCIKNGFNFVKELDSLYGKHLVNVICESDGDISTDMLYFNYKEFITVDAKALIRQELNYVYTPVFLALDKDNKIVFAHIFTTYDDSSTLTRTFDYIKEMIKKNTN